MAAFMIWTSIRFNNLVVKHIIIDPCRAEISLVSYPNRVDQEMTLHQYTLMMCHTLYKCLLMRSRNLNLYSGLGSF